MAKEYVCREDVINDIGELFTICRETLPNECGHHFIVENELQSHLDYVRNLPAADVAEVRHGRWIEQPPDFDLCGVAYYQCSECGKEQQTPAHYCQFCGARMEGWKWCVWQDEDNEGVYCTAHIHEDRVLNCPYKDLEERQRADYPCQDYRPMDGWQCDV